MSTQVEMLKRAAENCKIVPNNPADQQFAEIVTRFLRTLPSERFDSLLSPSIVLQGVPGRMTATEVRMRQGYGCVEPGRVIEYETPFGVVGQARLSDLVDWMQRQHWSVFGEGPVPSPAPTPDDLANEGILEAESEPIAMVPQGEDPDRPAPTLSWDDWSRRASEIIAESGRRAG